MSHGLSKSRILAGLQCHKRLWLDQRDREVAAEERYAEAASAAVEHRFAVGNQVNEVMWEQHPGGHLVKFDREKGGMAAALSETERVMAADKRQVLFEGTFSHDGVLVQVDVLQPGENGGYRLLEVKSSTKVKEVYLPDCAVQKWVLEGCGVKVEGVELVHINNQFVYPGGEQYAGLFSHADIEEDIEGLVGKVEKWVEESRAILAKDEPMVEMGDHCTNPYECQYMAYCQGLRGDEAVTEYPVRTLPWGGRLAKRLEAAGIRDIREIPQGVLNNAAQQRMWRVAHSGKAELGGAAVGMMEALGWPRFYLDFETVQFAIPIWVGTRPYQQLPFQWSCHLERPDGRITHGEFLDTGEEGPMRQWAESLIEFLGEAGEIFVYGHFEKMILEQTAEMYPPLEAPLMALVERLVDLLAITRANYYHPAMAGSWSLKNVLPTVAPGMGYDDLGEVQDGGAAALAYMEMMEADAKRQRALRESLLAYCKRDTEALVALVKFFRSGRVGRR